MILKELTPPHRLLLTEIIKRRLTIGNPRFKEIEKDLAKRWAGYWGELALANYVKQLPQDKYYILHDLQLQVNHIPFQMDTLLLSQKYLLIIEAKNIVGTLYFDNLFKQLIRINDDGSQESFEDPRIQCQRLQSLLRNWLTQHSSNLLPIETLIFFKSNQTILKTNHSDQSDLSKICKGRDFFNKMEALEQQYTQTKADNKTLIKIGNLLASKSSPKQINILEEYNLTKMDVRTGVCCPNEQCSHIPMNYKRGKWSCPACQTPSKDAHLAALNDYLHLFGPTITNAELRSFLHLPTNDIAQKFLNRLELPSTGKTKNRLYQLSPKLVPACGL